MANNSNANPKLRLEEAGYALKCAAPEIKIFTGKHGYPAASALLLKDVRSEDCCGLLGPGGFESLSKP